MFKNMKIKFSLILEHTVAVGISALLIIACLNAIATQQKNFDRILDVYVNAYEQVLECRLHANTAARAVREVALFPNSAASVKLRGDIDQELTELDEHLEELARIDPVEDGSVEDYIAKTEAWKAEAEAILSALDQGRTQEARTMIEASCSPKLREMAVAGSVAEERLSEQETKARNTQQTINRMTLTIMIIAMIVAVIGIVIFATRLFRCITRPVEEVRAALVGFSEGKLDIPVEFEGHNELGEMCEALRSSQLVLSEVISDAGRLLEEMGHGNFNVKTKDERMYVGALSKLLSSIRVINYGLSDTLNQLLQNAEQVAAGSNQVSDGSQALAQGATEQASAVEELTATIALIADNAQQNAEKSQMAMEHSQAAGTQVQESSRHMDEMVDAMERISGSSEEIGKIIATIENIAFQTNILALNAAVEAARAGSAGKGFAVVADEVRNLAAKSDQAAKATKELIERSINAVRDGDVIVKSVSDSLDKTVKFASQVLEDVQSISAAAAEQSESIVQVTTGLDQISAVVQTNSATSEESAAASQELSSQAAIMKRAMERFQLRDASNTGTVRQPAVSKPVMTEPPEDAERPKNGPVSTLSKY